MEDIQGIITGGQPLLLRPSRAPRATTNPCGTRGHGQERGSLDSASEVIGLRAQHGCILADKILLSTRGCAAGLGTRCVKSVISFPKVRCL